MVREPNTQDAPAGGGQETDGADANSADSSRSNVIDATRLQFAKRLRRLTQSRGWSQSELSRRSGVPRDAISTYFRAASLPMADKVKLLARAFNMAPEDLLATPAAGGRPSTNPSLVDATDGTGDFSAINPMFVIRAAAGQPGAAWVHINKLVKMSTALKIAELLENEDAANGSRSSDET